MYSVQIYEFHSKNAKATENFAERIGTRLKGGEVIELVGDVGSGKTTFTRGLAKGAGSKDRVSSPTFTVSNVYKTTKGQLYHYDFYRLDDLEMIKNDLVESCADPRNSIVLEWAQGVKNVIKKEHLRVEFVVKGEELRTLVFKSPAKLNYLKVSQ